MALLSDQGVLSRTGKLFKLDGKPSGISPRPQSGILPFHDSAEGGKRPGTIQADLRLSGIQQLGKCSQRHGNYSSVRLEYLGIRLDSNAVEDLNSTINLVVTDTQEQFVITLRAGVLLYQEGVQDPDADAEWRMPKAALFALLQGNADGVRQAAELTGGEDVLDTLCEHIVVFTPDFNIVEP